MKSKKSKKINGGDIIKKLFGGMSASATPTLTFINMILLGVIIGILIYIAYRITPDQEGGFTVKPHDKAVFIVKPDDGTKFTTASSSDAATVFTTQVPKVE